VVSTPIFLLLDEALEPLLPGGGRSLARLVSRFRAALPDEATLLVEAGSSREELRSGLERLLEAARLHAARTRAEGPRSRRPVVLLLAASAEAAAGLRLCARAARRADASGAAVVLPVAVGRHVDPGALAACTRDGEDVLRAPPAALAALLDWLAARLSGRFPDEFGPLPGGGGTGPQGAPAEVRVVGGSGRRERVAEEPWGWRVAVA